MSSRRYEGPALDGTVQHLSEAPYWQGDGETIDVVDDRVDGPGDDRAENVPLPDGDKKPAATGQTTLDDWRWSL